MSVKVEDLCELVTSGGTPSRKRPDYFSPGVVPWVKTMDLRDGPVSSYDEYISHEGLRNSAARMLPRGTVLMAMYGATVGRLGWLVESAACNQAACAMVANASICDSRWLFYALMWARPGLVGLASGAAQQNLNSGAIREFRLPAMSLADQRRIGGLLTALDEKVAANNRLKYWSVELGAAIFEAAFEADGGAIPLGEIARHHAGKYLARNSYGDSGNYYVYGSNSIMGKCDTPLLEGPFAVLAKIGTYCGSLRWSERAAWINNNASALLAIPGVDPWVLRHALHRVDMFPHRSGSGQPYIRIPSLMSAFVDWPSSKERKRIGPVLRALASRETAAAEENECLERTRDELLPLLMLGSLKVEDAKNIVEEVL